MYRKVQRIGSGLKGLGACLRVGFLEWYSPYNSITWHCQGAFPSEVPEYMYVEGEMQAFARVIAFMRCYCKVLGCSLPAQFVFYLTLWKGSGFVFLWGTRETDGVTGSFSHWTSDWRGATSRREASRSLLQTSADYEIYESSQFPI